MSKITIKQEILAHLGLPTYRPPTTPGEVILEEFLKPLNLEQKDLAEAMKISEQMVNYIINGKRRITLNIAIRLSKTLGCTTKYWLGFQQSCDLYKETQKLRSDFKGIKNLNPNNQNTRKLPSQFSISESVLNTIPTPRREND